LAAIGDLARLFVGLEFHIRLRPLLRAGEVPMTQLGGNSLARDGAPAGSRLGWTTWILSEPSAFDRSDAAFAIMP
jgi:predicted component of type VI protein secretion system